MGRNDPGASQAEQITFKIPSPKKIIFTLVAEVAFFAFLYYVQDLLKIEGNLWISSLVMFVLLNVSILACPYFGKCCR